MKTQEEKLAELESKIGLGFTFRYLNEKSEIILGEVVELRRERYICREINSTTRKEFTGNRSLTDLLILGKDELL